MDAVLLIAALAIAFAIGSNDTSNAFGICVGCGLITIKRATLVLFILVFLGFILAGSRVMHTVGGEIAEVDEFIVATSLLVSSASIVAANYLRTPVSSHQAIVASLIGSALAVGRKVDTTTVTKIVLSWIVSPFGALLFAVLIYWVMERLFSERPALKVERVLRVLLLIAASIIGFNTGANELATALAPVVWLGGMGTMNVVGMGLLGSAALFLGALLVSIRVAEVVGKGITTLDSFSGFAAQIAAGVTVLLFTFLGMPVSTSYCTVGAVTGVGIYKGLGGVRFAFLKRIAASWVLTPTLAFSASFAATHLLQSVF